MKQGEDWEVIGIGWLERRYRSAVSQRGREHFRTENIVRSRVVFDAQRLQGW